MIGKALADCSSISVTFFHLARLNCAQAIKTSEVVHSWKDAKRNEHFSYNI
jgi:hypothetical protein